VADLALPGARDARGTLDVAGDGRADAVVVAAPPHPRQGGRRTDGRLRAVSDALGDVGVDCLRFDYGPWDEGRGERADVRAALRWARADYDRVGAFGYSFGASVTLLAAADAGRADPADDGSGTGVGESSRDAGHAPGAGGPDEPGGRGPDAVSVLAPAATLSGADVAAAVRDVAAPFQVVVGERDEAVDWRPVAAAARERGADVVTLPTDHGFVGRARAAGETAARFLSAHLDEGGE
jgi:alpha/beta superfamily hydrolase